MLGKGRVLEVIWVLVIFLTVLCGIGWYLFYRSVKVMFQLDQMISAIIPVLSSYSQDLDRMSTGDLLTDHPEVKTFHRRNLLALRQINEVIDELKQGREQPPKKELPRPDVE